MSVYLVGAGPGDPGLITAKGLDLVRTCEALVYDVLVAPELVEEAPDDALLISREGIKQDELNRLLGSRSAPPQESFAMGGAMGGGTMGSPVMGGGMGGYSG